MKGLILRDARYKACARAHRRSSAWAQLACLWFEVSRQVNHKPWRWYSCWFTEGFWMIACYRVNRFCYLLLGRLWPVARVFLAPLFFLARPWMGNDEIHYKADIGRGLKILHPSLGVQISKTAQIGEHLELAGGNAIGRRRYQAGDRPVLGNNVRLGIGAIVLGPVKIGDNVQIGAGAVVLHDVPSNTKVAGVPAHPI